MADIVLTTLNAKYIHAAFGLRYLLANLGELRDRAVLAEFDINQRPLEIVERILAHAPRIVGLGVYIWNVAPTTEVVALLKRLRPEITVILGGPEVSYEPDEQEIVRQADYVIGGEADRKFAEVCRELLNGRPPTAKLLAAGYADLAQVVLPYDAYDDRDLEQRIVYVEASRGCPFGCEFCLSALDIPVRQFDLGAFLAAMERLLTRGVGHFKFVDRTFNLNLGASRRILEFFLERLRPGLFLHFEMVPDRLPTELREVLARFPAGALQLEIGVQTFNGEVATRIDRRQDDARLEENIRFLRQHTGAHLHADLIVGLPGESFESFGAGFDRLVALAPQEIQVGLLKRLRGTPIVRHDRAWGMVYSPFPPYELLQNRLLDFPAVQRLRRFARYWDLVGNSGNFVRTVTLLWEGRGSPFQAFLAFSDWLFAEAGRQHGIALPRLAEFLFRYLTDGLGVDRRAVATALRQDYHTAGRRNELPFLRELEGSPPVQRGSGGGRSARRRQLRHRGSESGPPPPAMAAT